MRLKSGFVVSKAGEDYVAVATGEAGKDFHGLVRNNETAAFLLEQLKKEKTEEELVQALLAQYEVTEEKAREDVKVFVETIEKAGMLAE